MDEIGVEEMILPLVAIAIAGRASSDPDTVVTLADVDRWETEYSRVPEGAFVVMKTVRDSLPACFQSTRMTFTTTIQKMEP